MSGETEANESGWTIDTLKAHYDTRLDSLEQSLAAHIAALDRLTDSKFVTFRTLIDAEADRVGLALASADKAVSKAEVAAEKRFEAVNEFRGQLNDQAGTFMTRVEADAIQQRNTERIQDLTDRLNRADGQRSGSASTLAVGFTAATIVITVVIFVVNFVFAN